MKLKVGHWSVERKCQMGVVIQDGMSSDWWGAQRRLSCTMTVSYNALWAWIVVFSKSVVLSLTRKFLLCNIPGFFPAAGQFNQILDCCTGCGDMANLTVSALS